MRPRRSGWTITELIVVLAILTLLIGLLAPGLRSVRSMARRTQCQSNLRQMTLAAANYAATWDRYPVAIRYERIEGQFAQVAWDWVTTFDGKLISPGPLWMLTNNPSEAQRCPEYDGPANFSGDPYGGYNYNTSYVGGEAQSVIPGWDVVRPGLPPHACRRGTTCAMFGCGGWAGGANKFMRAPLDHEMLSLQTIYSGGQAFRHARATNIAFVDGHIGAAARPYRGAHATDELLGQFMRYPANGFLSDDDSAYDPR